MTRDDLYVTGNAWTMNMDHFLDLHDRADSNGVISMDLIAEQAARRFDHSVATNPNFYYGPVTGMVSRNAGILFLGRLLSNHTAEHPDGILTQDIFRKFFGVYKNARGTLEYRQGHETIPENWYRKPVEYGLVPLNLDLVSWVMKHPVLGRYVVTLPPTFLFANSIQHRRQHRHRKLFLRTGPAQHNRRRPQRILSPRKQQPHLLRARARQDICTKLTLRAPRHHRRPAQARARYHQHPAPESGMSSVEGYEGGRRAVVGSDSGQVQRCEEGGVEFVIRIVIVIRAGGGLNICVTCQITDRYYCFNIVYATGHLLSAPGTIRSTLLKPLRHNVM
jgi:hypothetical protein